MRRLSPFRVQEQHATDGAPYKQQALIPHGSGAGSPRSGHQHVRFLGKGQLPGLQMSIFSCPRVVEIKLSCLFLKGTAVV